MNEEMRQFLKYLKGKLQETKGSPIWMALEAVEYQAEKIMDYNDQLDLDLKEVERKADLYDELVASINTGSAYSQLSALRDPMNWQGNEWKPYLSATNPDILEYLDEAFKEVGNDQGA